MEFITRVVGKHFPLICTQGLDPQKPIGKVHHIYILHTLVLYHHHDFPLYWAKCLHFAIILENKLSLFSLYRVTHIVPLSCKWGMSLPGEACVRQTYFSCRSMQCESFSSLKYLVKVKILKEKHQNTPNLLGIQSITRILNFKTLLEYTFALQNHGKCTSRLSKMIIICLHIGNVPVQGCVCVHF